MHCKDVSVREVGVSLTENNISELMKNWTAYRRAEYLVLKNGNDYATLRLEKPKSSELFIRVSGYEILSLPENTVFVEQPDFDVVNLPTLAEIQSRYPGKTVVVKGMFSHIVIVHGIKPKTLAIVETVPPEPPKLSVLAKKALDSGYIEHPIVTEEKILDSSLKAKSVKTKGVVFPCKVSGLDAKGKNVYYLDCAPEINEDVTLIGCKLSKSIFLALYGKEPAEFVNICPADFVDSEKKTLVRCCRIREGHVKEGNVAKLPWGATVPEVVDAINDLFDE